MDLSSCSPRRYKVWRYPGVPIPHRLQMIYRDPTVPNPYRL